MIFVKRGKMAQVSSEPGRDILIYKTFDVSITNFDISITNFWNES